MWIRAVLACVVISGCFSEPHHETGGVEVAETCPDNPNALFFPVGMFAFDDPDPDQNLSRSLYSNHLRAMQQPPLSCGQWDYQESYRVLWIRHFDTPLTVSIFRNHKNVRLEAVMLNPPVRLGTKTGSQRINKRLSTSQWKELSMAIETAHLWGIPSDIKDYSIYDGDYWIIEVRKGDRYQMVHRSSSELTVEQMGLKFVELAELTD